MLTVLSGEPLYPLTLDRGRTVYIFFVLICQAIIGEINNALSKVSLADIQGGLIPSGYALSDESVSYEAGRHNSIVRIYAKYIVYDMIQGHRLHSSCRYIPNDIFHRYSICQISSFLYEG